MFEFKLTCAKWVLYLGELRNSKYWSSGNFVFECNIPIRFKTQNVQLGKE